MPLCLVKFQESPTAPYPRSAARRLEYLLVQPRDSIAQAMPTPDGDAVLALVSTLDGLRPPLTKRENFNELCIEPRRGVLRGGSMAVRQPDVPRGRLVERVGERSKPTLGPLAWP